jgi:hypothetical protein
MMKKTIWITGILLALTVSCKEDEPEMVNSKDITISSKTLGTVYYYSLGFSFEQADFIPTLGTNEIIDIYLVEATKISGELTGVQFATKEIPESTFGFYNNGGFSDLGAAEEFYNNYITANAPQFSVLTDTVRANHVWTFKTYQKNWVKILVKDVRTIYSGQTPDYMEVDIRYFIQRDGSDNLNEL